MMWPYVLQRATVAILLLAPIWCAEQQVLETIPAAYNETEDWKTYEKDLMEYASDDIIGSEAQRQRVESLLHRNHHDDTVKHKFLPGYDEDRLVGLIETICRALERLGHFEGRPIIYAPPGGHVLNISMLADDEVIDGRVVSLMRRLPVPQQPWDQVTITDKGWLITYTEPFRLASSRDILSFRQPYNAVAGVETRYGTRPTDMLLFDNWYEVNSVVILSVIENSIRFYGDDEMEHIDARDPQEHLPHDITDDEELRWTDYTLRPARHAEAYLQEQLDMVHNLDVIPNIGSDWLRYTKLSDWHYPPDKARIEALKEKLFTEYSWPNEDFREEDWKRDGAALVEAAFRETPRDEQDWSGYTPSQFHGYWHPTMGEALKPIDRD